MNEPTKLQWDFTGMAPETDTRPPFTLHGDVSNPELTYGLRIGTIDRKEDAELIVLAVNNHQVMAFALRKALLQIRLFQMKEQDPTVVLDSTVSELVVNEIEQILEDIGQAG